MHSPDDGDINNCMEYFENVAVVSGWDNISKLQWLHVHMAEICSLWDIRKTQQRNLQNETKSCCVNVLTYLM